MDKSRSRNIRMSRKERMEKGIIIETKVSLIRRILDLLTTLFFNLLIILLILILIDAFYAMITGSNIWFTSLTPEINAILFWGLIILPTLFAIFFIASVLWMRFKKHLYNPEEHVMEIPTFVRDKDIAEYFELPIEEIRRRQSSDELVIHDNIDNDRMIVLREKYAKKIEEEKNKKLKTE